LTKDVDQWLAQIGLEKYSAVFAENEVDIHVLTELTEQDLKDINIPLGPRKKLLKAIATLAGGGPPVLDQELPAARPEAERRHLTVMFCDLVGSTTLSTQFDPEDLREIIRAYQECCARVIAAYDGYIAKFLGDGVLIYFGYPQAHEDDAKRAICAGLDIVLAVPAIQGLKGSEVKLAVRVGIDTGLVVVGDLIGEGAAEQASVVGETPNVAAKLQGLAGPNHVVIGPGTHGLVRSNFLFESLGPKRLAGRATTLPAWRVLSEIARDEGSTVADQILPLVGRQEELGLLLRAWETSKNGRGQAVLIQGEAGIGKSRLLEATRAKLEVDHHYIVARCSPYHSNTTLYPVIDCLKRAMDWRAEDDQTTRLAKLEAALARHPMPIERVVPLYAELLELPLPTGRYPDLQLTTQERREQTLDALVASLFDKTESKPVLHLWEDLHWADPSTLELLRLCIEQSPTVAMMSVLTYRPDFVLPWPLRSHMTLITLNRLDRTEVEGLLLQQTNGKPVPHEVLEYVVRKTDGVPLYVEELSKAIHESDFLRDAGDRFELVRPLSAISIPATLQDLLMARLDRLPSIREVAQLGSILGREFAYEMLQAIASLDEDILERGLDQLVEAELLYQRGRRPQARYMFKHALVQDAAYQSLLKKTRQFYHRQVANLLETNYPEIATSQPELLAHHYAKAEENEKASRLYEAIAERSAAMYAHAEAVAALDEARAHVEPLAGAEHDNRLLALLVRQSQSLHFLGRRHEIIDLLTAHDRCLEQANDTSLIAEYYFWLGFAHAWVGHREEAIDHLHKSLERAQEAKNDAIAGRVHRALATEYVYCGKPLSEAIAHAQRATTLLERTEDRFWLSQALFTLSYCRIFAGDFQAALDAASRLNEFGDASGIRRAQANAAMLSGLAHAMRGEGKEAVQLCLRALDVAPDDFERAFILACLGRSQRETGNSASAVTSLEQAVTMADRVRSVQFGAWFRTMLAEAYLADGALEKAATVVGEAFQASTRMKFAIGVGLSRQVSGMIAHARGDFSQAQKDLDAAATIFAAVGAEFELQRTRAILAEFY
jgi:class 3 adenylate cyclase/tetratricopeptide (TPR) repeat protein